MIDRIMQAFADRWAAVRADETLTADVVYVLAFSLIMLNTDLHNPQIAPERKMTREQFVRNNRGIGVGGTDLPETLLSELYAKIKADEIRMEQREFIGAGACEGWLWKQGGKGALVEAAVGDPLESVLYFEGEKESSPKGLVPLENVVVRKLDEEKKSDRPFAFALSSSEEEGAVLKTAKGDGKGGSLTQGNHTRFRARRRVGGRAPAVDRRAARERARHALPGPERPTSRVERVNPHYRSHGTRPVLARSSSNLSIRNRCSARASGGAGQRSGASALPRRQLDAVVAAVPLEEARDALGERDLRRVAEALARVRDVGVGDGDVAGGDRRARDVRPSAEALLEVADRRGDLLRVRVAEVKHLERRGEARRRDHAVHDVLDVREVALQLLAVVLPELGDPLAAEDRLREREVRHVGRPYGPYTVKKRRPVSLSPCRWWYTCAMFSFAFFVAPYSEACESTWCFSENGITSLRPYTDDDEAYVMGTETLYSFTASSSVTKQRRFAWMYASGFLSE